MNDFKKLTNLAGWAVFFIAVIVYFFSAERTGSLWDCGEFITGAYKLQVVHPPGAPLFLLIGRMFTVVADVLSDNPENIAFSVNLLSGICTAFTATFVCWVTIMLGKLSLVGREGMPDDAQKIALAGAGVVAGLATAFTSSIWFSAVEGEVYAMSTFFTAMTLWATIKWYSLPDTPQTDRWLIFAVYSAGLSIGVHLLSLLTFPALALFYYFKKYKNTSVGGMVASAAVGVAAIGIIQFFIIVGIPKLWSFLEITMVNSFGLPFHTGVIPLIMIIVGLFVLGFQYSHQSGNALLQKILVALALVVISYSTMGMVVIRANTNPPINMNNPSDPLRLIPYINREQYGERALLKGPYFEAKPIDTKITDRYGQVGDRYEVVDQKVSYVYKDEDQTVLPRMGDNTQTSRIPLYRLWMNGKKGKPSVADNISFMLRYQIGWMYWRYFMWNFSGRQNGDQGFYSWDPSDGNWITGIKPIDSARLYNQDQLPESMKAHKARNNYYMLPFLFGLLGLLFHFGRRRNDFIGLFALFIITGIGIIIYSNQPPNEPRERDYVLVGSFFTYCIWIGFAVLALFEIFRERTKMAANVIAPLSIGLVMIAPLLMGFQNFDDHSRKDHSGARDYANNFLQSCEENAIIFTYGDNDTYPLWYAQEVEGIRTDVRVVNLSLISVDWYIDQLRRKVNDSPKINMTIPRSEYRGKKRNQVFYPREGAGDPTDLRAFINFIGESHPLPMGNGRQTESYMPTRNVYIPVDKNRVVANKIVDATDSTLNILDRISWTIPKTNLIKGELAVLDIIASNLWDRPIYFAVTCRQESLLGLQDYLQLEGLGLRIVPLKTASDGRFGIIGSGRVDSEKVYENVMNDFRWGNFGKEDLFVDRSFGPSVQSHHAVILRTAEDFIRKGDNEKAVAIIDKYFEAFPAMNFTYDYRTFQMMALYLQAGAYDKAKPHLQELARETLDQLEFFYSLDTEDLEAGFSQEFSLYNRAKDDMIRIVGGQGDKEFEEELKAMFAPYNLQQIQD